MSDFALEASRATEPYFYRAPHPEGVTPYDFQHAGVEYHLSRNSALYGDVPGLGKTCESVLLGNAIEAQKTLVVCPASLRLNWEREIKTWSTIGGLSTYPVLAARDGISHRADYVIVSYALLNNKSIFDAIMDLRWDHLILDEAHALKDYKGNKRVKSICGGTTKGIFREGIESVVGRITMASGTILPNQPIECYNAIRLLDWEAIDCISAEDFREEYYGLGGAMVRSPVTKKDKNGFPYTINELHWSDEVRNVPRNLADLQDRLRRHIMVRRTKEQCLPQLPPKQWQLFPLIITSDMRKALKHPGWDSAERMYEMDPDHFQSAVEVDGALSTARRLLGEAKAPSVAGYIEELLLSGIKKLVVGAWHHSVLDILREKLNGWGLVYMDGSTSTVNKQRAVDQFQTVDKIRIILGQTMPLGEGWTLHAAQDVVLAEPDWVPGKNDQILERTHRIGQTGDYVLGHVPVVPGTLDEKILGRAIEKDRHIHETLDKDHSKA